MIKLRLLCSILSITFISTQFITKPASAAASCTDYIGAPEPCAGTSGIICWDGDGAGAGCVAIGLTYRFSTYGEPPELYALSSVDAENACLSLVGDVCYSIEDMTPADCTFNSSTVVNGTSVTAYLSNSVTEPAVCTSETRSCNDGILSGSYTFPTCTVSFSPAGSVH